LPTGEGEPKAPYRLKLTLVDKGKIVVEIGSIAGYWLKDFWPGEPPEIWRWHSIVARKEFWDTALTNMAKIGDNRLSREDRKRIRKEIHRTVPWVMKWELAVGGYRGPVKPHPEALIQSGVELHS
jgi:hypothetical protein